MNIRPPANSLFHALNKIKSEQDEFWEHQRALNAKVKAEMKRKSRESFVEGNSYDGDGGREHADYMADNGRGS